MFCIFGCLEDAGAVGEGDRLRFVDDAFAESVDEVVAENEVKLVFAVEGICADVACSVSLDSLDREVNFWAGLEDGVDLSSMGVDFGGLKKSSSEDSLSDEVLEDEDSLAAAVVVVTALRASGLASASLSAGEVVADDLDAALPVAVAWFGASVADSLPDEEVSDDADESVGDLGRPTLAGSSGVIFADFLLFFAFAFFARGGFAAFLVDSSDSESEEKLEVPLKLAFRFNSLTSPFTLGFCDSTDVGSCAPAGSSSSSASLSEPELEVDDNADLAFDDFCFFLEAFETGVASSISTFDSPSSTLLSLSPLLLVSFCASTSAAASSLALASALACFFAFFDFLSFFVSELSSESLLLVSSICVLSSYNLYHSL